MNSDKKSWYLRKPDGSEYGPITTYDLQRWAAQCRIVAGNGVSSDREEWIKVEDIPELEMDWVAHRPDGSEYGPFNVAATQDLLDHNVLTEDTTLTHKTTKKTVTVQQILNEEDLFVEPETQDSKEGDSDELTLSEAALKEEEFYTEIENMETVEEQPEENDTSPEAGSDTPPEPSPQNDERLTELQDQVDKLSESLNKSKADLALARKELKSYSKESTETIANLTKECEQAKDELASLKVSHEKDNQKHRKALEEQLARLGEMEVKLESSVQDRMQAEVKLANLENERSNAEDQSLQNVAELRKQKAFMKKNSATLQHELEKARAVASRRGQQLVIVLAIVCVVIGTILLTGKTGCRKADAVKAQPLPQTEQQELAEDLPLSKRSYRDTIANKPKKDRAPKDTPPAPIVSKSKTKSPRVSNVIPDFPKIMVEGVKLTVSGNTGSIRFDSGVFKSLTTASESATSQLLEVADILRPLMNEFKIVVEGCTDNKPLKTTASYNGNHALGLARAETIKKLLVTKGKLPGTAISARYAGENNAPYPNDTAQNRKRNRTVVLKLVRSK